MKFCPKVCFCVVGDNVEISDQFSTFYDSVIVFGRASKVAGEEAQRAMIEIVRKYCLGTFEKGLEVIRAPHDAVVYKIEPEHISGKQKNSKLHAPQ